MKSFSSLLKFSKSKTPGEVQEQARQGFPRAVADSEFALRDPSQPLPPLGTFFVLGVATYSADDLELLDNLHVALRDAGDEATDIEVFNVLDCRDMQDFERFIPGIGNVFRNPVMGIVVDGHLVGSASGLSDVKAMLQRFRVLVHQ